MNNKHSNFAEVVESSLDHLTAQCWQWNRFPTFASLVQIQTPEETSVGIVTSIQTGSIEPGRTPFAYQKTEEELYAQQPQIFEFLKTTFIVHIIGYHDNTVNTFMHLLPNHPSKIHAFVKEAEKELAYSALSNLHFLHILFSGASTIPYLDELLLALIKNNKHVFKPEILDAFSQQFSLLTGNDYRRLKLFFMRLETIMLAQKD